MWQSTAILLRLLCSYNSIAAMRYLTCLGRGESHPDTPCRLQENAFGSRGTAPRRLHSGKRRFRSGMEAPAALALQLKVA